MKENIILQKSLQFSARIYRLNKFLVEKREYSIADQLLRSGTSVGANVYESSTAESKKDFISKISISLKEAKETEYWLLLLKEVRLITDDEFKSINNDCLVMIKLLAKIRSTSKKNH